MSDTNILAQNRFFFPLNLTLWKLTLVLQESVAEKQTFSFCSEKLSEGLPFTFLLVAQLSTPQVKKMKGPETLFTESKALTFTMEETETEILCPAWVTSWVLAETGLLFTPQISLLSICSKYPCYWRARSENAVLGLAD